jgi:hypothetical protein
MLDPTVLITIRPQYAKLGKETIKSYIELVQENYDYNDNILQLAVFHYLEIELNGTDKIIERSGDQDTIKIQPLRVNSFWDLTDPGRMFKQLAGRSASYRCIRP